MAYARDHICPTSSGEIIISIKTVACATDCVDINDFIKEQIENWQNDSKHPERKNYKLRIIGGSESEIARFVLEHKTETCRSAISDIWDLKVDITNESGHLRLVCSL